MILDKSDFDIPEEENKCLCGAKKSFHVTQIIIKPKSDVFQLGCVCMECRGYTGVDKRVTQHENGNR